MHHFVHLHEEDDLSSRYPFFIKISTLSLSHAKKNLWKKIEDSEFLSVRQRSRETLMMMIMMMNANIRKQEEKEGFCWKGGLMDI